MIQMFFLGICVGLIMVGGLALGIRWLFRSRSEELPDATRTRLGVMGVLMLVGQLLVAGLILVSTPGIQEHPIALAVGMLSMNLLLPVALGWFDVKKNRSKDSQ